MSHQPEPDVTWRAEVFDDTGDEPVSSHEYPGSSARGLAISFVQNTIRRLLATRIKDAAGEIEKLNGRLVFVGDDDAEPVTFGLRGRVQRGTYRGENWHPDTPSPADPTEVEEGFRLTEDLEIERALGAAR
jgi:hypothetical protein